MRARRPLTRSLPAVLRKRFDVAQLRIEIGEVVSTPDAEHVEVRIRGENVAVPKLAAYVSPVVGEACYLVVAKTLVLAIGGVDPDSAGGVGTPGPPGTPGEVWYTGSGAPAGATGIVGDWYLDSASGDYYEKTGASAWALRGNLKGPTGATGPEGPEGPAGPASGFPPGVIMLWPTATPPTGWLICDGQSTSGYPDLAAVVGANVPNLKGRVVVGLDAAQTEFDSLGETGGSKVPALLTHTHIQNPHGHPTIRTIAGGVRVRKRASTQVAAGAAEIVIAGGGEDPIEAADVTATSQDASSGSQTAGNMPPYHVLNYVIKT